MTERKNASTIKSQVLQFDKDAAILAGKDFVGNGSLQLDTNNWSTSGTMSATATSNGRKLTGDGYFFQNIKGLTASEYYSLLCYVEGASGTITLGVGNAYDDTTYGSITLATGWNTLKFQSQTTAIGSGISTVTVGSPTTVDMTAVHGLTTGDKVQISDITGNAGSSLSGDLTVTVTDTDSFTVAVDTTGTTYTSGGVVTLPYVFLSFTGASSSDYVELGSVQVRERVDFIPTGDTIGSGTMYINNNWRYRASGATLYLEYSTDGFTTVTIAEETTIS